VIRKVASSLKAKMRFIQWAKWKAAPQRAIRAIYGRVLVERAPHLHAGPCGAEAHKVEVAQMLSVSQPPTWPWLLLG